MINLRINNQTLTVPKKSTIWEAAQSAGIFIPTMCYLPGHDHITSCMLCVVQEMETARLLPACSAPAENGMVIETANDTVFAARRDAMELLLSEHVGDCEAPCRRACPAFMNIPQMIRQLRTGRFREAIITIKKNIALPGVLGRICRAPCQAVCNRKQVDEAVEICWLKGKSAAIDGQQTQSYIPDCQSYIGKRIAIVGSGPAGLAAAFHLQRFGYACTIYERNEKAGGTLRYQIDENRLPKNILDNDIGIIEKMGVRFHFNTKVGKDISFEELIRHFDALILTTGVITDDARLPEVLKKSSKGIQIDNKNMHTSVDKVYAGGSGVGEIRMAVRAEAQGKAIAFSVHRDLQGANLQKRFDSRSGRRSVDELQSLIPETKRSKQIVPSHSGLSANDLQTIGRETAKCLHCDCRAPESCKLRYYADMYDAQQPRYFGNNKFERVFQHSRIVYEPGKCIKCGLCVQITANAGEEFGLTFIGRGFDVQVDVPLSESLESGLQQTAARCVEACPTGAIAFFDQQEEGNGYVRTNDV